MDSTEDIFYNCLGCLSHVDDESAKYTIQSETLKNVFQVSSPVF